MRLLGSDRAGLLISQPIDAPADIELAGHAEQGLIVEVGSGKAPGVDHGPESFPAPTCRDDALCVRACDDRILLRDRLAVFCSGEGLLQ
jgi:hypothetical protein